MKDPFPLWDGSTVLVDPSHNGNSMTTENLKMATKLYYHLSGKSEFFNDIACESFSVQYKQMEDASVEAFTAEAREMGEVSITNMQSAKTLLESLSSLLENRVDMLSEFYRKDDMTETIQNPDIATAESLILMDM